MSPAIKLLGFVIFVIILWRTDRTQLASHIAEADKKLLLASVFVIYGMYLCKAVRWHTLVKITGANPHPVDSWHIFMIGAFLGIITPGRVGELGQAAYLKKYGIQTKEAISLVIFSRLVDVALIGCIAIWGGGILFGAMWTTIGLLFLIICTLILIIFRKHIRTLQKIDWLQFTKLVTKPSTAFTIILWTLLGWSLYFTWTILIARAVNIDISIPTLVAVLTITGIVALLPIAPAGLGTREATMMTLLVPIGVNAAQTVAFSMLIFAVIVSTGMLGGWYWIREK